MCFLKLTCLGFLSVVTLAGCTTFHVKSNYFFHSGYAALAGKVLPQINAHGYTVTSLFFRAKDGTRLHGLLLTNPHARVTVLDYNGNAFQLGTSGLTVAKEFERAGVNAFLFEYRGYGKSAGKATLTTFGADALAAFDYVRGLPQLHSQPIVVFGVSLGSFVAPGVALRRSVAGLVMASTATDVSAWAHNLVPWYAKPFVRIDISPALRTFNNKKNLEKYRGPLLLLAGAKDTVTSPKFAHQLFQSAATPADEKMFYESPSAGHAEILEDPNAVKALDRFIREIVLPHANERGLSEQRDIGTPSATGLFHRHGETSGRPKQSGSQRKVQLVWGAAQQIAAANRHPATRVAGG